MANKKSLTLGWSMAEEKRFMVIKAQNNTAYLPGQSLTQKQVDDLCAANWEVTIVHISKA